MATFLDIGLAQHFSVIFPVLLVFVFVFAILEKTKVFGENKGLHGIIALCLSLMMLFVPGVVTIISTMAPWFVLIFLFITFLLIFLMTLGVEWTKITSYMSKDFMAPHWILLVILLVIFIGSIGASYGDSLLPYSSENSKVTTDGNSSMPTGIVGEDGRTTDTGDFNSNVGRVIFHPKVLGMLFLLLIGSLTIKMLSGAAVK